MKLRTLFFAVIFTLLYSSAAFAWNCSDPLASRVDIGKTQPSGSAGDGDGQWYKGSDAANPNDYYVCQVPKPPKKGGKPGDPSTITNSSSSTSGATSSSTSGAAATGGNATATGGAGGSVNGSGNSTNNNNNTANGGAGGQGGKGGKGGQGGAGGTGVGVGIGGGASNNGNGNGSNNTTTASGGSANGNGSNNTTSASAAASNNGNGSNDSSYSSTTNVAASKIPVATAYAPTTLPTSPCTKGFGGGVQTMAVGGSFGMSTVDKNCVILEAARNAPNLLTFCKVYITHKAVKAAGVTLRDCMESYAIPEPVVKEVVKEVIKEVPVEVIKEVVKEVPAPTPAFQAQLVGICTFASQYSCDLKTKTPGDPARVTTICDDMLRQAITLQHDNPGTIIRLIGNENNSEKLHNSMYALARAKNVQRRLVVLGASPTSIAVETGKTGDRTVEIWVAPN